MPVNKNLKSLIILLLLKISSIDHYTHNSLYSVWEGYKMSDFPGISTLNSGFLR